MLPFRVIPIQLANETENPKIKSSVFGEKNKLIINGVSSSSESTEVNFLNEHSVKY